MNYQQRQAAYLYILKKTPKHIYDPREKTLWQTNEIKHGNPSHLWFVCSHATDWSGGPIIIWEFYDTSWLCTAAAVAFLFI